MLRVCDSYHVNSAVPPQSSPAYAGLSGENQLTLLWPPPCDAGLSGESSSIGECQLIRGVLWPGFGGIDVWGLVDVGDGSAGEQAQGDEFGEADRRYFEPVVASGDAQQQIGDHGGGELQSDGVGAVAEELSDLEVLLDPSEQQLDLPACLVEAGDGDGGALEVVGDEGDLFASLAFEPDAAHRDSKLGVTLADQPDLGVVEDGEATGLALLERPPLMRPEAGGGLHAGHEAGLGLVEAGPPPLNAQKPGR